MPTADGHLTAGEIAQIYALLKAQSMVREQLTRVAVAGALAPLRVFTAWWDHVEVTLVALQILRVTQATQAQMAQVTDAYLARMVSVMSGRATRPLGAVDVRALRRRLTASVARRADRPPQLLVPAGELDLGRFFDLDYDDEDRYGWPAFQPRQRDRDRRVPQADDDRGRVEERWRSDDRFDERWGRDDDDDFDEDDDEPVQVLPADMVEVYSRPAAQYRYLISEGATEQQARQQALKRAAAIAEMDVQLAARAQTDKWIKTERGRDIRGWRRVVRPELSKTGPCGLCIVAADRVYHTKHLQPIHERCRCEVLPIVGSADPGLRLNREDLKRLYDAAGGTTSGRELKKVRAVVTEHGELGPILREAPKNPRGSLRGPRKALASRRGGREQTPEERIPGLEKSTAELQARFAAGETRLGPAIEYQKRLVEQLRRELVAV